VPSPKKFELPHDGGTVTVPDLENGRDTRELAAERTASFNGAPLVPTGTNPMLDSIGPGSWCERPDKPDQAADGEALIVPMSSIDYFSIAEGDPDPHGMAVYGLDGEIAGTVSDVWVDRAEQMIRYFEVSLDGGRSVLLPHNFVRLGKLPRSGDRVMHVKSITAAQFADVPAYNTPAIVPSRRCRTRIRTDPRPAGAIARGRAYRLARAARGPVGRAPCDEDALDGRIFRRAGILAGGGGVL